ncbi:MAG: sugar ABC transporter permease, partial [Lachnospiraceae bacterium]|nr:sugar ABC transporter permease [Lachnospiraceae bacterium]
SELLAKQGRHLNTFAEDVKSLFDQNIHKFLLSGPVISVFAFTIIPIFFMALVAFTNYDQKHQPPGSLFHWVGFKNFAALLSTSSGLGYAFWHVLGWTMVWAVFATFLNYFFGIILALVIDRKDTKLKSLWRFIFVLSIAVPQFVSLLIMRTMLQPEGSINILLKNLGLIDHALPFWTNATWARVTIIIVNLWVGIPFTMLQVTGILMNIPKELYEAAEMDGAGPVTIFFKITMPYILFVTTPYLITSFIGNINNFNVIYLLTGGAPASLAYNNGTAGKTDLLVTWLYKLSMDYQNYNYAAVISILVFILSATFSLVALKRSKVLDNEEAFQ